MNRVNEYWWKLSDNHHQTDLFAVAFLFFPVLGKGSQHFQKNRTGMVPAVEIKEGLHERLFFYNNSNKSTLV